MCFLPFVIWYLGTRDWVDYPSCDWLTASAASEVGVRCLCGSLGPNHSQGCRMLPSEIVWPIHLTDV